MQNTSKKRQETTPTILDEISNQFDELTIKLKNSVDNTNNSFNIEIHSKRKPPEEVVKMKDFFDINKLGKISNFATTKLNDKNLIAFIGGNLVHFFAIEAPTRVKLERFEDSERGQHLPCSMFFIETVSIVLRPSSSEQPLQKNEFYFPPQGIPTPVEDLTVCDFTLASKERLARAQNKELDIVLACAGSSGIIHLIRFDESLDVFSLKGHANEVLGKA
jgi:hypothetical protein